ncbi:hypothetical protein I79_001314 [Cricetulus griseus]|uniref:Uncharacterized protein n=1 Tax=Cricetulus griseus TaxID=10029 RepID=G3GUF5_CRIGR|nr:hypothetical protein I79_001314 [Cricetulus griseus]
MENIKSQIKNVDLKKMTQHLANVLKTIFCTLREIDGLQVAQMPCNPQTQVTLKMLKANCGWTPQSHKSKMG